MALASAAGKRLSEFSARLKANYLGPQKHHGEDSRCERLAAMSPAPLMCCSAQKHLLCALGWVLSSPEWLSWKAAPVLTDPGGLRGL